MNNKQYLPQTGPYLVKVRSGQSTDNWQDFEAARLQISVGNERHEAEKLSAVSEWCLSRFKEVFFCVNDTLQRFNLMFEQRIKEEDAQKKASKLGQQWITRNQAILENVPQAKLVTWEEWKEKAAYNKGYLKTQWFYSNNEEFRASIDDNIEEIWSRRAKSNPTIYTEKRFDEFLDISKRFLLEEITAFSLMFHEKEAIDIYPGTTLFAATTFQGREVEGAPIGLGHGHFCRIDFLRNENWFLIKG